MNRPRIIKRLRIAVSAVCMMVFVGLIGLWVRTYSWHEAVWLEQSDRFMTLGSDYAPCISLVVVPVAQLINFGITAEDRHPKELEVLNGELKAFLLSVFHIGYLFYFQQHSEHSPLHRGFQNNSLSAPY